MCRLGGLASPAGFQLIHILQLSMNTLYNVWYITYHYNNNIITMQLYKFFFFVLQKVKFNMEKEIREALKNQFEKVPKVW